MIAGLELGCGGGGGGRDGGVGGGSDNDDRDDDVAVDNCHDDNQINTGNSSSYRHVFANTCCHSMRTVA
jgi:hypothetical protein